VQDRYVGDIGDFGKYALLNALAANDLRLGVQWCHNADEEATPDGKFTCYSHLRGCDSLLYDKLEGIVQRGYRAVTEVQSAAVLPSGTLFFSESLSSRQAKDRRDRRARRKAWNARALEVLSRADLVFMDPDNGLGRDPADSGAINGAKYVFSDELRPYFQRGQSLVIYQHQTREKGGLEAMLPRIFRNLRSLGFDSVWALIFRRSSVRVYFVLPAPAHLAILADRSEKFLDTEWGRGKHFSYLPLTASR
jgi:hypothetical protein